MGTYADLLNSQAAAGAKAASSSQADYAKAKAQAQASIAANEKSIPAPLLKLAQRAMAAGSGAGGDTLGRISGGIAALSNAIQNAGARASGGQTTDTDAVYRAYRDASNAYGRGLRTDNPVSSTVGMIGALEGGGAALKGGGALLGGLEPVAAALSAAKASAPVAALTRTGRAIQDLAETKLTPTVAKWAAETGKAALSGGTGLGLLDVAQGKDAGQVAQDVPLGAAGGGLLRGVAAPVAGLAGKGVQDLVRYIGGKLTKPATEATPEEVAAAKQTFANLAQSKGLTAENVAEKAAPYSDPLAGQLLGVEGQNLTGGLARRGGDTGDITRSIQYQRAKGRPAEIAQAAKKYMGFSPDEANDIINARVAHGQATVAPMYKAAEESPLGLTRPDLESLLATKTGKSTLANVTELAKLKGLNPEGLTYAPVEVPPPGQAVNPMEAPPVGDYSEQPPPVPRGPAQAPSQGPDLIQFMRNNGGLRNDGGEMAAMGLPGIGARSKFTPQEVDAMIEKAHDAGYFPEHPEGQRPTQTEFLDKVRQSITNPVYARQADPEALARYQARAQAEADQARYAQRYVEPPIPHEDYMSQATGDEPPAPGYGGAGPPQYEPAMTTGLTPRSLIHLHQLSKPDYDVTGKLAPGDANQAKAAFHGALGRILTGDPESGAAALIPQYQEPKDIAQQYLGLKGSYGDFTGSLTSGKMKDFQAKVAGLKDQAGNMIPEKLQGAQLAAINDVHELWAAGQLRGGKFLAPGVQLRLATLFGADNAAAMVQKMERTAEQAAAESRMAPFSNSSTAAMTAAGGETDAMAASDIAKIGKVAGKGLIGGLGELAQKTGTWAKTAGSTVGYRNALGKLMTMTPDDLEALLRDLEAKPPPATGPDLGTQVSGRAAVPLMQRQSRSSKFQAMAPGESLGPR